MNYGALKLAWEKLNKKAAPGVDKVTTREFSRNLEENLNKILESLKGKRYHAKLVRRKYIDKGNGKKRPLGIPALSDKIVQRAAADIKGFFDNIDHEWLIRMLEQRIKDKQFITIYQTS